MLPRLEYFECENKEVLDVALCGSGRGIEESESVKLTFQTAKEMGRSVVMFNFPYMDRGEVWVEGKSRVELIDALKDVLKKCKSEEYKKVRLIGKSLGGMVAADYLNKLNQKEHEKYELVVLGYIPGATNVMKINCKITIFQGSGDMYGNAGDVRKDIEGAVSKEIVVHEIGGASHSFKDLLTGESKHFKTVLNLLFLKHIVEKEKSSRGRKKAPEIEPVVQKFDYDCGWAAVNDLLLILQRGDVLKTDLYQRLEVSPIDGTRSQNIKKLFNEENISYVETSGANIADLEDRLDNGYVCLVGYQAWGTDLEMDTLESGHYSIVFSVDEEGVWVLDPTIEEEEVPGAGKGVICMKKEEFDKRWMDKGAEGEIYDHWMLAVR